MNDENLPEPIQPDEVLPERPETEARWSHTGVHLRVPSGTDPFLAVREAMGVFMERTDGTNAIPWWQRETWWHGGGDGIRVGADIVPPSVSGLDRHMAESDPNAVYVTRNREDAVMYACWHRRPMLYEVLLGPVEPEPDDVIDDPDSFKVPKARVRKIHGLTRPEVESALRKVFGVLPEG